MHRDTIEAPSRQDLLAEVERLRARLDEAEQTLDAIRHGDVDALVVHSAHGERLYTLEGADHLYRAVVETMNDSALTVDEDGTILFCNPRFCELVKSPMEATIGRKLIAFAAPPQHVPALKLLAEARSRPVQRRLTLRATDGSSVSVQLSANRLVTESGASVCLVATDLTELEATASLLRALRQKRQALEESLATLQSFYDSSPLLMGVLELDGDRLVTLHCNAAVAEWHGRTAADVAGLHAGELGAPPEVIELWLENLRICRREGRPVRFDFQRSTVIGQRWLSAAVGYIGEGPEGRPRYSFVTQDVTEQRQAAEDLVRLNQTLEQRVAERTAEAEERARMLRRLAGELAQAEQRERRRLAELLHDDLQQVLFAARLQVSVLHGQRDAEQLGAGVIRLDDLLERALQTSRGLTSELAPSALYFGDLASALRSLAHAYQTLHGLTVEVTAPSVVASLDESVRVFVFQGVRELLLNVVKHAGVTTVQVDMAHRDDGVLEVAVSDRGRGFADTTGPCGAAPNGGFGLFSVRERVALLGGELHIESRPGEGTRVALVIPLDPAAAA